MLPRIKAPKKCIYLDHAAATPLDKKVRKAMEPFWYEEFGNPSSLYQKGISAAEAVGQARKTVAELLHARPEEIIFTAGGTESVNTAIFGVAKKAPKPGHIVTSSIEHQAVLNSVKSLEAEGFSVTYVGVSSEGFVNIEDIQKSIRSDTILVSLMYANNEIGSIQPIAELGKWLRGLNDKRRHQGLPPVLFHTDACQAAGALDIDVQRLGVDLFSANASKVYGPKQVGFLYARTGVVLKPLLYGGEQERGMRAGTENVAGVVGLAAALELVQKNRSAENKRIRGLRNYLWKNIQRIPGVIVNGPDPRVNDDNRLPNNLNVSFEGVEGESLLIYLDSYNIAVSTGSACTTANPDPSHVLLALGHSEQVASSSIRFTLGKSTTKKEVDYVLKVLPGLVENLRKF